MARTLGVNFCSVDHLGVDMELDLHRLTADDPIRCVFDVGGNFGQSALRFAAAFPQATVFTFEPVRSSFERLQAAVQGHRRIKPHHSALGDTAGTARINLTGSAVSSTILPSRDEGGNIEIAVDTIDAFVATNAIETIDLLKIDVEGYELQVLKGANDILQQGRVRHVFAECVLPEDTLAPHTSFFDLHKALADRGFCFVSYYGEGFRLSDGCALGNVLYALRSKLPARAAGRIMNIA